MPSTSTIIAQRTLSMKSTRGGVAAAAAVAIAGAPTADVEAGWKARSYRMARLAN
jgi:hypothetical protein